jgi:hypothetical protein
LDPDAAELRGDPRQGGPIMELDLTLAGIFIVALAAAWLMPL